MNEKLLFKILDSDLGREIKEKILSYWLLPPTGATAKAPIQKTEGRVGAVRRPDKKELDLRKNPKIREEQEAMEETLDEVVKEEKGGEG